MIIVDAEHPHIRQTNQQLTHPTSVRFHRGSRSVWRREPPDSQSPCTKSRILTGPPLNSVRNDTATTPGRVAVEPATRHRRLPNPLRSTACVTIPRRQHVGSAGPRSTRQAVNNGVPTRADKQPGGDDTNHPHRSRWHSPPNPTSSTNAPAATPATSTNNAAPTATPGADA